MLPGNKFVRPSLAALIAFFALALIAAAGSLTPSASPAGTMHSVANIYDVIASSAYDSTLVAANQNGSLFGMLKYIEANMPTTGVASDAIDFDELVDSMTLDANLSIASAGYTWDFTDTDVHFGSTAIHSYQDYTNLTWDEHQLTQGGGYFLIDSDAAGQYLIVGSGENVYLSSDYGNTWTAKTFSPTDDTQAWAVASDATGQHLIVGFTGGHLYTSDDYGATWTERIPPIGDHDATREWWAVASDATGQHLIVSGDDTLYTSDDYGATWTERVPSITPTCWVGGYPCISWGSLASDASGRYLVAAAGDGGSGAAPEFIYTSDDYGVTWTPRDPAGDGEQSWQSIASDDTGKYLIASSDGGLYTSSDYGVTWTKRLPGGDSGTDNFVASDGTGRYLLTGDSFGRLYLSSDFGISWIEQRPAGDTNQYWGGVALNADGSFLAAGASPPGYVYTTTANGLKITNRAVSMDIMTLTPSGNIRIGATASETKLELVGTASVSALFVNGVAVTGGSGVSSNSLDWDELANSMTLDANTSIASAGYLFSVMGRMGVGTSTPGTTLEVKKNTNSTTVEQLRLRNDGSGTNAGSSLTFYNNATQTGFIRSYYSGNWLLEIGGSSANGLLKILSTGEVNISNNGANNTKLSVLSSAVAAVGNTAELLLGPSSGFTSNVAPRIYGFQEGATAETGLRFDTYTTAGRSNRVAISAAGLVGISTKSPAALLDVTATTSFGGDLFNVSSSTVGFFRITEAGNVGIGTITPETKLEVVGTASASRMYIGLWGAGSGNALCHTNSGNASASEEIVDCTSGPSADYMELYPMDPSVEEGEIVAPDTSVFALDVFGNKVSKLVRSQREYQDSIIGITSIASLGTDFNMIGRNLRPEDNPKPLALAGRVRVKVSTKNGPIAVGDRITASDIPGVGMKATRAGVVVGSALESLDTIASESQRIMVFVQPQYWAPEDDGGSVFEDMFAAVIKAFKDLLGIVFSPGGVIEAQKLCLGDSCITQSQLQELMQRGRVAAPVETPTPTPIPTNEVVGTPTSDIGAETPTPDPTT